MDSPTALSLFTPTKDEIRDFSFYDQPEDMSAMASPLASPLSESSTISRSSSTESLNSLASEAESSCGSSDEVFFGPVGVKERALMAKLNKSDLSDSVRPNEKESDKENPKRRLTRRDSREFHRRKTLVFSSRGSIANSPRPWGDGFFLKAVEATPSPLALGASITSARASPATPQSHEFSSRQQPNHFNVEDERSQLVESSSRRISNDEDIDANIPVSMETIQLEDPEELDSPDDPDRREDFDHQSDVSDDEEAGEAIPNIDPMKAVTIEVLPSSESNEEVEEPVGADAGVAEKEEQAEENPAKEPTTSVEIRLEEPELQLKSKRLQQDQLEVAAGDVTKQDHADLPIMEQLMPTEAETGVGSIGTEPRETAPDVTHDSSEVEKRASLTEDELISRPSIRSEAASEDECQHVTTEEAELSQSLEEPSTDTERTIQAAEDSESLQQVLPLDNKWPTEVMSIVEVHPVQPEAIMQEDDVGSSKQTDAPTESPAELNEHTALPKLNVDTLGEVNDSSSVSIPPPTPSIKSEAGETTFDPESPMPLCRAPKPEVMMVYMSRDGRGPDRDVIPFNRQLSLSPVAHVGNATTFSLGSFDLAKETVGSSTLRLRQTFSPDKRTIFAQKSGAPNTPMRTPSKTTEPPRSGLVQRSIALPPVTRILDRTLTRPDASVLHSRNRDSSRKKADAVKKEASAIDNDKAAERDPFLAGAAATPVKSKRKSLRLMKNPTQNDRAPDVQVTSETRQDTPLRSQPVVIAEPTPVKPISSEATVPTPPVVTRVVLSTESRLRQPSKSLLKKPSTSFLPVLKSSGTTARPATSLGHSSSAAIVNNNLSSSTSSTSSTFDFVQPVPPSKITSFMTSVKSRPIMPMPMKSPAKQLDVFTSALGAPVRPNRAPIVSTSTGPPVRPNMTPMRNGIRSFGSPVRSNLSPIKNPLFGTPQRSHPGATTIATPHRSFACMDSPQVATNRSRARPLLSSLVGRKAAATTGNENTFPASRNTGPTGSVREANNPLPDETPVVPETSAPVPQDTPATTPTLSPPQPIEVTGSLVSAMVNDTNATAGTSRRSLRPARAAGNLASSATSEAVKPSKAASKRDKVKPSVPLANKTVNVDIESITKLNTARNEVVFSAITTIKQRRQGERPRGDPLTVAEKIAALSREERAVRRQLEKSGVCSESEGESCRPTDSHRRGPGETEDYMTPARPVKRAREESESPTRGGPQKKGRYDSVMLMQTSAKEERRVKWDKGLIMISDSRNAPSECSSLNQAVKSCLKKTVRLDHLGNVPNANLGAPSLQPLPVEVFKIRYDGEDFSDGEPGETKANKRAEKGKGRKKAAATSEK